MAERAVRKTHSRNTFVEGQMGAFFPVDIPITTAKRDVDRPPVNYKWFSAGEFHTAPWGADQSPYGGRTYGRVKVTILGKEINPTKRNGIASVQGTITKVHDSRDQDLIGTSGWWRLTDLSRGAVARLRKV